MKEYFYCYSNRLHLFLASFGISYITTAINPSNNKRYWMYKRTPILEDLIKDWNIIKEKRTLEDVIKKKN